ncbi:MAG TPA: SprT family zinc-dependent metalloprotease [Armatimonadota bacterium]|nr:SprT family zinc-dependent metalloprotease [Armatimonadota bacterium]
MGAVLLPAVVTLTKHQRGGCVEESAVIRLGDRDVEYRIVRSHRSSRVRLKVGPATGLVVVVPVAFNAQRVPEILAGEKDWILKHVRRVEAVEAARPRIALCDGGQVMFGGRPLTIQVHPRPGGLGPTVITRSDDAIHVALARTDTARLEELLLEWLQGHARSAIHAAILDLDPDRQFRFDRLCIRDQRTRWGSCSSRGELSFSWRLIMAPPEVLRYVVAHELAHIRERSHSRRFWSLVGQLVPDYDAAKRWLRTHGAHLEF